MSEFGEELTAKTYTLEAETLVVANLVQGFLTLTKDIRFLE